MFTKPLVTLVFDPVFSNETDERLGERIRRNSDSVLYVKPKENEVTVVLSKLKQAEIKFQQEKIERLEKKISEISSSDASSEEELVKAYNYAAYGPSEGNDSFCFIRVLSLLSRSACLFAYKIQNV